MPPFGNHHTIDPRMKSPAQWEESFARALFSSRFLALFAVLGVLLGAVLLFLKGTLEIIHGTGDLLTTITHTRTTEEEDKALILTVVPAIDNYLFAMVLLIFGMGIYGLFINTLDPLLGELASRPAWIKVQSLDDLRMQISEVVIMILVINFFDLSFAITLDRPLDLPMLGGGVFLVALALFLTQRHGAGREQ